MNVVSKDFNTCIATDTIVSCARLLKKSRAHETTDTINLVTCIAAILHKPCYKVYGMYKWVCGIAIATCVKILANYIHLVTAGRQNLEPAGEGDSWSRLWQAF